MAIGLDEKIDWFRVIVDLCYAGHTHSTIAASIGAARTTVRDWKRGATPRYEEGERLLVLWATVTKKRRETAPTVHRYSYRA